MCSLTILEAQLPKLIVEGAKYSELRIYQHGNNDIKSVPVGTTFIKFEPKRNLLPWVTIEVYSTEPIPDRSNKANQFLGAIVLPLQNGIYNYSFFDPSLREDLTDKYLKLGSAKIKVDMCFTVPEYMKALDNVKETLFEAAKEEQVEAVKTWVTKFMPRIIHPGVKWFFLQRFTLQWENVMVPAWYFVLMANFLPAASDAFVEHMYRKVSDIHGIDINSLDMDNLSDSDIYKCQRVLADMVTLPAVSDYYNGDHAGVQSVERFSMGCYQRLDNGDCEDFAQVIFMTFESFRKNKNLSPILRRLFDSFQPLICTGAASYKSLTTKMTSKDFICHVWTMLIPNNIMNDWRGVKMHPEDDFSGKLSPIMAEGTNYAEPMGRSPGFYMKNPDEEIERIKYSQKLAAKYPQLKDKTPIRFNALEKEPENPSELSTFYRYAITVWPREGGAYHLVRNGMVGVELFYVLGGDPSIHLEKHDSKETLTNATRLPLLACVNPPQPLQVIESEDVPPNKGVVDKNRMVEVRVQTLEQLKSIPLDQFANVEIHDIRITGTVRTFVVQLTK
jgi:hypothetical protein